MMGRLFLLLALVTLPISAHAQGIDSIFTKAKTASPFSPQVKTLVKEASCDVPGEFAEIVYQSNTVFTEAYQADVKQADGLVVYQAKSFAEPVFNDAYVTLVTDALDPALRHVSLLKGENDNEFYVVYQSPHNWRGDDFQIYATQDRERAFAIAKDYATLPPPVEKPVLKTRSNAEALEETDPEDAETLHYIHDTSFAPLLIRDPQTKQLSYIAFQPKWTAFQMDDIGEVRKACRINFPDTKLRFPSPALKRVSILLDAIIGVPKEPEGTLRPVATLRHNVRQYWRNALYRPWAMPKPYNSRKIVDERLAVWANGHKEYARQYRQLMRLYPQAERDLTTYYKKKFRLKNAEAKNMVKIVLDTLYRSHFVFGK